MQENNIKQQVESVLKTLLPKYMSSSAFTDRKLTDTPTDALSVVPRKFVTMNGVSANRPTTSIVGQYYFDTTLGQPIWWSGISFVDADGNAV